MKRLIILALMVITAIADPKAAHAQKFENLAMTPPMGWNSWNRFACNVDEKLIRETADAMASIGMKDAGYQYVVIDDCWHGERDAQGFIRPNAQRFPSGMKALGDYIHSKGLKFGIYADAGWKTCGGHPGSRGHEYQDALTYAGWGVDYLKYDWCNTDGLKAEGAYTTMREALRAAGRPIVLSICEWGDNKPWEWAGNVGHLWRTTGDIYPCWDCEKNYGTWSSWGVMKIVDKQAGLRKYAGPGHWNDPDMMEIGNGLSTTEDRAHFSMWAMLAAPMIAGNDLRNMSAETRTILTNKDVIAIDQDALGIEGFRTIEENGLETWIKPLSDGGWAVCFLNRGDTSRSIDFDWTGQYMKDGQTNKELNAARDTYRIRDLWTGKDLGTTASPLKSTIQSHDVVMLRLSR